MIATIIKAISGASARLLISILWTVGDKLFDWFVTVERAQSWRAGTLVKWTSKNRDLEHWQPKNWLGKMWKENSKAALDATGAYMNFSPYQTTSQRAEKLINAGGVHQP